ncbi:MAG: rRNA maturation RNase YbeY [Helicobacteraceae bacterium]|nr:rRNA maturation RNase YbeY [Helicobacteraceae bacterium]
MIAFETQLDFTPDLARLGVIAAEFSNREIELILVNDAEIHELNRASRGVDLPTDVLSFPIANFPKAPLGSIVISLDTAKRVAAELKHDLEDEIAVLFLHGLLHLLEHDHETDSGEFRELERDLCVKFALPSPLTARAAIEAYRLGDFCDPAEIKIRSRSPLK